MTAPHQSCSTDPRLVGDPVDTLTGAVTDLKLEFRLTGPIELPWLRLYDSSRNERCFALGWGQTHVYDRRLHWEGTQLAYEAPLGERLVYPLPLQDGECIPAHGHTLQRLSARRYALHRHAEPSMAFEFRDPAQPARMGMLFKGEEQIRFEYDAAWQLHTIVDSVGRRISVEETPEGRLLRLTLLATRDHPEELLVAYRYDADGHLQSTRNAAGHGYAFTYDAQHRMVCRTGRKGFRFQYRYDEEGRCVLSMGEDRLYGVALDFVAPGRLTRVTRPDQGVWSYSFDAAGRLTQIRDAAGGVKAFVHDESGRVAFELDPNQSLTRIEYDAAGAPVARVTAHGQRQRLPEDPNAPGPRDERLAANPAEFEYGAMFDRETDDLPSAAERARLDLPSLVAGLVTVRVGPAAPPQPFHVEPLGAMWWPAPAAGRRFNHLGKLVSQQDAFGRERHWTYDASGNLASFIDFDGSCWTYDTGQWHFLLASTTPLGAVCRWTYTHAGGVESLVDAGGTRSEYRYDQNDHLVEVKRHGAVRDIYVRDAVGNLLAKRACDGRELLRLQIGPANLPLKRLLASGDEHEFAYDADGRCLVASTLKDSLRFAYDARGRGVKELRNGIGVEHDYRGSRWPLDTRLFGRFSIQRTFSRHGVRFTDPTGTTQHVRLLGQRLVQRRSSNGSTETAQYDVLGRCLFKAAQHRSGHIWSRRYLWSGEGELRRVHDSSAGEILHAYDAAHRLAQRRDDRGTELFEFDAADNLLRQPGLAGVQLEGNRLVAANGQRFSYNDRQHVAMRTGADGAITQYEYDSRDLMVRIVSPHGEWEAEYDALGRRCRKRWRGETTEFHWDGEQLIAEVAPGGGLRIYVYSDRLALTPLMFIDYENIDADPATGRRRFVFSDQVGVPCQVEDDHGAVLWKARVLPFGQTQVSSAAGLELNLRFPGHYLDVETGLHYNRHRYYDPQLGRYLQSDPWGIAGGPNTYAYRSNPLLKVDVRGLGEEGDPKCARPNPDEEGTAPPTGTTKAGGDADAPSAFPNLDRGGRDTNMHADRAVAAMGDVKPPMKKNRSVTVIEHNDGTVSVGISGGDPKRAGDAQKVVDQLNTNHPSDDPNKPTYRTSGPVDGTGLNDPFTPGEAAPPKPGTCSEPQAAQAAGSSTSKPEAYQTVWSGPGECPEAHQMPGRPTTPGGNEQMQPCPTCQNNTDNYDNMANAGSSGPPTQPPESAPPTMPPSSGPPTVPPSSGPPTSPSGGTPGDD